MLDIPLPDSTDPTPAFLGVESSLSGKRWRLRPGSDRASLTLTQRLGCPEVIGRLLAARGLEAEAVPSYLAPTLRDHLPDPSRLKDMDRAADRLAGAIMSGERVAVFGDYDVDGATASALLSRFMSSVGAIPRIYIPDRRHEGYGPNGPALLRLGQEGVRVVITVDCGSTAHEPLAVARDAGIDVIVVDHHAVEAVMPPAFALVNPNRLDDESGSGVLAAVGVVYLLVIAVNRALRNHGWYETIPEPDLLQWLDLVALGTVADVVPLVGINRALVRQGLKVLTQRRNMGLAALIDVAGVVGRLDAYHLGFVLGPRVNAGGRVGQADLGAKLLATLDKDEATQIAASLDLLNAERREVEALVLAQAIDQIESGNRQQGAIVIAHGDDWHPGVIGIVAARLKERYNRPALAISWSDGHGKGSGRSVPGIDLGAAIIAARQAGHLLGGGGHRMAAGFVVTREALLGFAEMLQARIGAETPRDCVPELGLDGVLAAGAATSGLIDMIAGLGPFGSGNPEPRFVLRHLTVLKADVVGSGHVRCILAGPGGERLKAISFRSAETPLGLALLQSNREPLHLAGHLRMDEWQGAEGIQFLIDDGVFAITH